MAFTQDDCRRFSELVRQRHESAFVILRALGLISVLCYFLHFVSYWRLTPELRVAPARTKKMLLCLRHALNRTYTDVIMVPAWMLLLERPTNTDVIMPSAWMLLIEDTTNTDVFVVPT